MGRRRCEDRCMMSKVVEGLAVSGGWGCKRGGYIHDLNCIPYTLNAWSRISSRYRRALPSLYCASCCILSHQPTPNHHLQCPQPPRPRV